MILLWFNPNDSTFYTKYYTSYFCCDYYVGYKNSYNHEVITIYFLNGKSITSINDYYSYKFSNHSKKNNWLLTIFKSLIYKLQIH